MGLVYGVYDAKTGSGFVPGRHLAAQLHAAARPRRRRLRERASNAELKPDKLTDTMAFMFETRFPQRVTAYAAGLPELQTGYGAYGKALKRHFDPNGGP